MRILRFALVLFLSAGLMAPYMMPGIAEAQLTPQERERLQAEYDQLQREIDEWNKVLTETRAQKNTLQGDVTALNAQIKQAEAAISQRNIIIGRIGSEINNRTATISSLEDKIERGKVSMAELIRRKNELDSYSLVEAMLSTEDLSEFFSDADSFSTIKRNLHSLFFDVRMTRAETEKERLELQSKRDEELDARREVEAKKRQIATAEAEKKELLAIATEQERSYQAVLAERQARATQIRAALFPLANVDQAIPFGTALQYAQAASAKTGVRPAFLLAIIQQESALGANTGSCVITDVTSGQTKNIRTENVFSNGIHPTRDLPPLQSILKDLGRNPLETRVSCPVAGVAGYGGAMGPAQFIPSTWNLIKNKLVAALGKAAPDPWNPADAFMASAVLLADNMGNTGDKRVDERTAACRYYSGRTCYTNGQANVGLSYGNQVLTRADNIQKDVDFLQNI